MFKIGTTERGDPALDLSWVNKMDDVVAATIISKSSSKAFREALIKYQDKIIYHATVTGYGGSIIEPNVPSMYEQVNKVKLLIALGFPVEQIVLRLDPVIPTERGIKTAVRVLEAFEDIGITRCRFSFIDMYPHVIERFNNANIPLPFFGFSSDKKIQQQFLQELSKKKWSYIFESCAEYNGYSQGCISDKDLDILGLSKDILIVNKRPQRKACLCPANKTELLSTPKRCAHGCMYCYWKD